MKGLILICFFTWLALSSFAQISNDLPAINLKDLKLKGPVREVIDSNYMSEVNQATADTSHKFLKTVKRFDKKGNETLEIAYDENNNVIRESSYDYSRTNIVKVSRVSDTGRFFDESLYKLNARGLKIQCDHSENQFINGIPDTVRLKYIFKYDSLDRINEVEILNKDSLVQKFEYSYNSKNQRIEDQEYDGQEESTYLTTLYTYDASGSLIKLEQISVGDKSNLSNLQFHYENTISVSRRDKLGNWHLKVSMEKSKMISTTFQNSILKRGIVYY